MAQMCPFASVLFFDHSSLLTLWQQLDLGGFSFFDLSSLVYRFRPFVSIRGAHLWFSGRILACHAGCAGSIPGQCSWLSSWLFFDSAQGRRKIKGQALSPRRGIEPRSPARQAVILTTSPL